MLPEQIVDVPLLTAPAIVNGATVMLIVFDVAFGATTQGLFETVSQVMASLFESAVDENIFEFAPTTFEPFTFHW